MGADERQFHRILADRFGQPVAPVSNSIGDDLAVLDLGESCVLFGTDMLLDGVHFSTRQHSLEAIGYKTVACVLSDCAAMAATPVAVTLSMAVPRDTSLDAMQNLLDGADTACEAFECQLVGGDTTAWSHPLAIDACMMATCPGTRRPVLRSGARAGDGLFVTGPLGGSLLGKHMKFVPRIREAELIAQILKDRLHAMIDITDGLAIDADRVGEASNVGIVLDAASVDAVASDAARQVADEDRRSVRDHVLSDGEDFELLLAADISEEVASQLHLMRVGSAIDDPGLHLRSGDGTVSRLEPAGYQHRSG